MEETLLYINTWWQNSTILYLLGWVGNLFLAASAIPQAYLCYKQGHARGVSWGLLFCWYSGEILTFIYVLPKMDIPLLTNYISNVFFISIILRYKIKPLD